MVVGDGYWVLSITLAHLRRFGTPPALHRDPFDRMMIAQPLAEGDP
jgi:PIN domain nuclease of toxin-antitoxin system